MEGIQGFIILMMHTYVFDYDTMGSMLILNTLEDSWNSVTLSYLVPPNLTKPKRLLVLPNGSPRRHARSILSDICCLRAKMRLPANRSNPRKLEKLLNS